MFVEILPNMMPPIIVEATVRLGYAIFAVAGLTFLGFGVQPPVARLGGPDLRQLPLLTHRPAALLVDGAVPRRSRSRSLVVAVNLVADGSTQVLER